MFSFIGMLVCVVVIVRFVTRIARTKDNIIDVKYSIEGEVKTNSKHEMREASIKVKEGVKQASKAAVKEANNAMNWVWKKGKKASKSYQESKKSKDADPKDKFNAMIKALTTTSK